VNRLRKAEFKHQVDNLAYERREIKAEYRRVSERYIVKLEKLSKAMAANVAAMQALKSEVDDEIASVIAAEMSAKAEDET
jgi:hypothetical protein